MITINVRPVWRDLDLSPLGDEYRDEDGNMPSLRVRVNWTRGHKERRWGLGTLIGQIQREDREAQAELARISKERAEEKQPADSETPSNLQAKLDDLSRRSKAVAQEGRELWAEIFDCTSEEIGLLMNQMPSPHWDWLLGRAHDMALEYEAEEAKKLAGSRLPGSQKRRKSRQK